MVPVDLRPKAGNPPGPPFLPRLLTGKVFRQSAVEFLVNNALRYGDLVRYRVPGRYIYQFNHPELIQELLVNHEPQNHRGVVMQRARFVLGNGLLTSEEPLHMRQRRMAAPAFHRQRIAAYGAIIGSYAMQMTERWKSGAATNLHPEMLQLALRIVGKCLFDADVESEVEKIACAVDAFMGFLPLVFLPFSRQIEKLPFGPMAKIRKGEAELNRLIYAMIHERRQCPGDRGDLLSILLASVDTEENTGGMSDEQVRDECLTVMLAGHETTANGLSFALWLLARHPEIQDRVHDEAVSVLGSRTPAAEDFANLRYTYMVFAETMRIYPPVWVTARACGPEPYNFRGFRIEPGSVLIAPQIVVHHDSRFWPDPERFDPSRFTEGCRGTRPRLSYFPFGAGSRQCIGEGLAWMEGVLTLAVICRNWRLRPSPGSPEKIAVSPMISLRPKHGVHLQIERR